MRGPQCDRVQRVERRERDVPGEHRRDFIEQPAERLPLVRRVLIPLKRAHDARPWELVVGVEVAELVEDLAEPTSSDRLRRAKPIGEQHQAIEGRNRTAEVALRFGQLGDREERGEPPPPRCRRVLVVFARSSSPVSRVVGSSTTALSVAPSLRVQAALPASSSESARRNAAVATHVPAADPQQAR